MEKSYLFVSYAREDLDRVRPVTNATRKAIEARRLPVELWMDIESLQPGEVWDRSIAKALRESIGLLVFVSRRSVRSSWVLNELGMATSASDKLIVPVLLDGPIDLPPDLARRQWLDLSGSQTAPQIETAGRIVAQAIEGFLESTPQPKAPISKEEAPLLAADFAEQARVLGPAGTTAEQPTSVFVVHGHNATVLAELEGYLASVGVAAVVLARRDESPQSLFQKFWSVATQARFAIVLLSPDDFGASRRQYEAKNVGDRALQFRARQNVILELGFFYGRLGWENVFVLFHEPDQVFPNFELPSDLNGVVFDNISETGWQNKLNAKLTAAKFKLTAGAKASPPTGRS